LYRFYDEGEERNGVGSGDESCTKRIFEFIFKEESYTPAGIIPYSLPYPSCPEKHLACSK
jgi:hypothetical protein